MSTVAIIPARMGSSRFPGKPLARMCGRSMIEHVYRRTRMCSSLDAVYVATCDAIIAEETERFGGPAIMTSARHERASDRVAEAAEGLDADVVVLVQGDEPTITPDLIDLALRPILTEPAVVCVNLAVPIRTEAEWQDRNTIKVVTDQRGDALYFSRSTIPNGAFGTRRADTHKQVCVIPFRRGFLRQYAALPPTPLEVGESIDMLRLLEHGFPVRIVKADADIQSVDTPEDLKRAEELLRQDPLTLTYEGM